MHLHFVQCMSHLVLSVCRCALRTSQVYLVHSTSLYPTVHIPSLSFATVDRPLKPFLMDLVSFCASRRPRAAPPYSQILNGIFVTLTRMGATGPTAPCCRQPWRDLRLYSPVLQSVFSPSCNIATCPFSLLPLPPALACMCNSIIFPRAVSPCSLHWRLRRCSVSKL